MRLLLVMGGLIAACSSYAQITPSETPSSGRGSSEPNIEEVFTGVGQHLVKPGNTLEQETASSVDSLNLQSYVLHLTREQFVFLDVPQTQANKTKTFFYHIVKGDNPTVMQMLHTTANCNSKQLKIDSSTLVSLDPPKVLNYDVVNKGWIDVGNKEVDQAIFKYVCFNEVTIGYKLPQPTGRAVVMYYNYLQQQKK